MLETFPFRPVCGRITSSGGTLPGDLYKRVLPRIKSYFLFIKFDSRFSRNTVKSVNGVLWIARYVTGLFVCRVNFSRESCKRNKKYICKINSVRNPFYK